MRTSLRPPGGELLLYQTDGEHTDVEFCFGDRTLWLSQGAMADLFQTIKQNIAKHLNIFSPGEWAADSVVNYWLTTSAEQRRASLEHEGEKGQLAAPIEAAKNVQQPKAGPCPTRGQKKI